MGKKIPLRQCVGCREMKTKKEMIRVIKTPENEVVLDAKGKQNGRGAYLCFSAECLQKARRSKGLERSLKISIPDEIYDRLEEELMLGLAAKAGKVASGEFSTEKEVKSGNACLVIVAEDASDNTKKLFRNMCKYYEVPMEIFATKEELGHWIGKAYRASICILDEGFAKSIVKKISLNMEG